MIGSVKVGLALSVLIFTVGAAIPAAAQTKKDTGSYLVLDVPGAISTRALGINKNGQIVGQYVDADYSTNAFLRRNDGSYTSLNHPEYSSPVVETSAVAINDAGQIVGQAFDNYGVHSYLIDADGQFTPIQTPGAFETFANGINSLGQVVGYYLIYDELAGLYSFHGFLRDAHGNYSTIDYPGANGSRALGINKSGQIVGQIDVNSYPYGFMLDSIGNYTYLNSTADAIDADGNIIFCDIYTWNRPGATLLTKNGYYIYLNAPGSIQTYATGIASLDQIVGFYLDASYAYHGFLRR